MPSVCQRPTAQWLERTVVLARAWEDAVAVVMIGVGALFVSAVTSVFILVHAFRRSIGTGVITLFVPGYVVYYAFSQFEHARKGPIVALWLGLGVLGALLIPGGLQGT